MTISARHPGAAMAAFGLAFADGRRWVIRAMDPEAEATVRELGRVMRLDAASGRGELCAVSGRKESRGTRSTDGRRLVCRFGPARDRRAEVLRMEGIATAIALRSLSRNGLLLHGALASRDGLGFVLAGPSGVGKSTASRRLPSPWQSLSDDSVLVVRDRGGLYWAHPWPTWSLLGESGPAASWPVEQAVPLRALFFLKQSAEDRVEPVTVTPAAALVIESAVELARTVMLTPDRDANRATCARYLRAARALAAAVPAFRLHVSLAGQFWKEMERAGRMEPPMDADGRRWGLRIDQKPGTGNQNAGKGSTAERLLRFRAGSRTFLKLVAGGRVVASASDALRDWHIRNPTRSGRLPARGRGGTETQARPGGARFVS